MSATRSLDFDPGWMDVPVAPRQRRLTLVPGVSMFDRLVPGFAPAAIPQEVREEIGSLFDLLDGRTVASVVAASPLGPQLTLRVLDKLVDVGAAMTAAEAAAWHARTSLAHNAPLAPSPTPAAARESTLEITPATVARLLDRELALMEADTLRLPAASVRAALAHEDTVFVDFAQLGLDADGRALPAIEPEAVADAQAAPPVAQGLAAAVASVEVAMSVAESAAVAAVPAAEPPRAVSAAPVAVSEPVVVASEPVAAAEPAFSDFEEAFFASEPAELVHERRMAALGDL